VVKAVVITGFTNKGSWMLKTEEIAQDYEGRELLGLDSYPCCVTLMLPSWYRPGLEPSGSQ
jgi:hypothetical protein